jgi:glutaconyl-CoA/methylmalonyl-CoA decarboxylase subunit gamma
MEHLRITVEGKVYDVIVEKIGEETESPAVKEVRQSAPAGRPSVSQAAAPRPITGAGDVASPLAGIVQAIDAPIGTVVKEGDRVVTLEAMKMYTPIDAVASGAVTAVHVKVGDAVEEGQILCTIG